MYATKFKRYISISILAAFIVFATVSIRYDQNQSEMNQEKLLPETFSRGYFSFLSQQVRQVNKIDKIFDTILPSFLSLQIRKYFFHFEEGFSRSNT